MKYINDLSTRLEEQDDEIQLLKEIVSEIRDVRSPTASSHKLMRDPPPVQQAPPQPVQAPPQPVQAPPQPVQRSPQPVQAPRSPQPVQAPRSMHMQPPFPTTVLFEQQLPLFTMKAPQPSSPPSGPTDGVEIIEEYRTPPPANEEIKDLSTGGQDINAESGESV